ncbi:MAG: hypothetical protein PHE68_03920 [Candidatus Peribacteraceae bacterium]|nr:hypothetical protein [Candidatus Peribacteraceae bacterium]MDD5075188.1 hypothetical protein [Candidatus Peribacteraceae bacterium]
MQRRDILAWMGVLVGSALTAAVLFAYNRYVTGSFLPHILPQVEEDSLYYLSQVREVLDGHPALGNPFIREYADAPFPGLRFPVWIAAIPGLLGADINAVYAINAFLYSILTGALFFVLGMRVSGGRSALSAASAVIGTASLHHLLIRPVIMQTVYPAFLLFLIALFSVLQEPHRWRRYLFLGIALVMVFSIYPFSWIAAFTATGLLFLLRVWQRDWMAVKYLLLMGIGAMVICLPQIFTTIALFRDPVASTINIRSGFVATHLVLPITIMNLKYTIFLCMMILFLRTRRGLTVPETLLLIIGASLVIGATSNVITGKEMDFDTHFWRLELVMNVVAVLTFLPALLRRSRLAERITAGLVTAALLFTIVNRTFVRANAYRYLRIAAQEMPVHRSVQEYDRVFSFFRKEGVRNHVIMSPEEMGVYIPVYTENYILHHFRAGLHVMPDEELRDRFLTNNVDRVNEKFLKETTEFYAGLRPTRTALYLNTYGGNVEPIDLIGGQDYLQETLRTHAKIAHAYSQSLQKFDVTYIVTDAKAEDNPRVPAGATEVFRDERFTVFHLS